MRRQSRRPPSSLCIHFPDKEAFLQERSSILQDGDSILIKASHYMGFEQIVSILAEGDSEI